MRVWFGQTRRKIHRKPFRFGARARSTAQRDNIIFTTAASVASPAAPEARDTFKEQDSSGLRIAAFLYMYPVLLAVLGGRIGRADRL